MTRQEFEDALHALDDTVTLVPAAGLSDDQRRRKVVVLYPKP
jgi:hypothetical protein